MLEYIEVTPELREDGKCGGCNYRGDIAVAWIENGETFCLCEGCSDDVQRQVAMKYLATLDYDQTAKAAQVTFRQRRNVGTARDLLVSFQNAAAAES